jgi:hypothetical protein
LYTRCDLGKRAHVLTKPPKRIQEVAIAAVLVIERHRVARLPDQVPEPELGSRRSEVVDGRSCPMLNDVRLGLQLAGRCAFREAVWSSPAPVSARMDTAAMTRMADEEP